MTSTNVQEKMNNVQEHVVNAVETAREAAQSVTAKVTDFFQGNPFETPIGRKIELATDATQLATENWGLIMEICDFINNTNDGARDAVRAIRKRLQTQMGKNNAIIMFTLTVLETCVKNCNQRFKALVCQKEFINEMVKIIGAKFDAPQIIQERVLSFIQSWADAFRGNPALSGVVEVYDELKSKGVEFPAMNFDSMAPIITPKRTVFSDPSQEQVHGDESLTSTTNTATTTTDAVPGVGGDSNRMNHRNMNEHYSIIGTSSGAISLNPEQLAKLRSELDVANVNLTVLRELLGTLTPNREDPTDFELLQQLYITCQEMQKRVVTLISQISNEEVTYELLTINDEFNAIFEKYNRYIINRSSQSGPSGAPIHGDLIDLSSTTVGDNFAALLLDDKTNEKSKLPANENYVHDQSSAGIRTAAFNKTEPISEREAKEITSWLNEGNDNPKKSQNDNDGL